MFSKNAVTTVCLERLRTYILFQMQRFCLAFPHNLFLRRCCLGNRLLYLIYLILNNFKKIGISLSYIAHKLYFVQLSMIQSEIS
jgi:hypothetical protein